MTRAELLALIQRLADALDGWADSKDDPELDALLALARKAVGK